MAKVFLIDGSSYFFRAYYAIRPLSTSKGLPTNAIFGFINMILKVVRDQRPDYLAVVFDSREPSFRKKKFEQYKANREQMPSDLEVQIPYMDKVLQAFRIKSFQKSGFEADDLIATLAKRLELKGFEVVIVTGDKDMMQLVSDRVILLDTMKDRTIGIPEVKERFGVSPDKIADVFGLAGDAIDNIPGVPGIGEKTAAALINQFGSLEGVYEHIDEVEGVKRRQALEQHRETAFLCRELAELRSQVKLDISIQEFALQEPNQDMLIELFRELEFQRLLKELDLKPQTHTASPVQRENYLCILDEEKFNQVIADLRQVKEFVVDLETTSLDPMQAEIVGIALAYRCHPEVASPFLKEMDAQSCHPEGRSPEGSQGQLHSCYIPVAHRYHGAPQQLSKHDVLSALRPLFENPAVQKIGQNIKYDALILKRRGIHVSPMSDDTMIASYILNPASAHNLDALALEYLHHKNISYDEAIAKAIGGKTFDFVPVEEATLYSGEDADVTLRLKEILIKKLEEGDQLDLYREYEMKLVPVLIDMEFQGVRLNIPFLQELSRKFEKEMNTLMAKIHEIAGEPFNIKSPQQLARILFEKLQLPATKRTKTGYSTNVEVLEELSATHPLPRLILDYREFAKLKSTYTDALVEQVNPNTGRIHTSYNQTIAATGRLSSSEPNLQNIPIRSEWGELIRQAFVPESGWKMIAADYSQVELRILAHITEDPVLTDAFLRKEDVHTRTAVALFSVKPEQVTSEMRRRAKAINFGIIYGLGAYGLSRQLGIPAGEARHIIDEYFKKYSGVDQYIHHILTQARKDGFVSTLFNRRRYLPDLHSPNPALRSAAERMAMNTPIQGTAADIMKKAMIAVHEKLKGKKSRLLIQVHDELVLEAPPEELESISHMVRHEMENAFRLKVPLDVEVYVGENWGQTMEWG